MTVKLIAVDMDGTFLNRDGDYDRERFARLMPKMQEKGIKFVIASGNQYFQIRSFFPDHYQEMGFVSENGANVLIGEEPVFNGKISNELLQKVLGSLSALEPDPLIVCGKNSAYVLDTISKESYDFTKLYYHRTLKVPDFNQLDDDIFKFAFGFTPERLPSAFDYFEKELAGEMVPVTSGHDDIDLIIPGLHKANGIKMLQEIWDISDDEVAAFGDGGNDLEMLRHAGYSFAMSNGSNEAKTAAKEVIGHHHDSAVLAKMEELIAKS